MRICKDHDFYADTFRGIAGCPYCKLEFELKRNLSNLTFLIEDMFEYLTELHKIRFNAIRDNKASEIVNKYLSELEIEKFSELAQNIFKKASKYE